MFAAGMALGGILGAGCLYYAFCVEPEWLEVTTHVLRTDRIASGRAWRIVQISDVHAEELTPVIAELPERIAALRPDFIVFTGDATNEPGGIPVFRALMSRLHARGGIYAVRGNHDMGQGAPAALFDGGHVVELAGAPASPSPGDITFCGAAYGDQASLEGCLRTAQSGFRVALYHSPDLVEQVQPLAPDLYLTGHTHGGQLRLPWFGAVITNSAFDKRYEMGLYQVGRTTLYVNRGIGTDGVRARFLSRPEVAVFDIIGTGSLAVTP